VSRVAIFIDYQNVYRRARDVFAAPNSRSLEGQVDPLRLAHLLVERGRAIDSKRELSAISIFRGVPSKKYAPVGFAASQRQGAAWSAVSNVVVTTRPLRYLKVEHDDGTLSYEGREKGIDVLLALAIAIGAERDDYDVCILCSADTDLLPALEHARSMGKVVEVSGWKPERGYVNRLHLDRMWCHWLDSHDFDTVADRTDYTRSRDRGHGHGPTAH
jgi:uncharacterized LabA/DUF88 family protein